ncbi:MAG: sensor histidine kinase, partial [Myxococcaceae bacterium]
MALATGSPSPEKRGARPRLWLVFSAVGLSAFVLGLLGLSFVRVYDDQLIRQTETELIAQGVVAAEAYRALLHGQVGAAEYGVVRSAAWPYPVPPGGKLSPILPSLRASSEVFPPLADPPPSRSPADERAQAAGRALTPLLDRVARFTLAGIRVVDFSGVVVASSHAGLGTTLADRDDVQRALRGEPNSMLRRRLADPGDAPLASLSRDTGVRVSVA